ncbi:hypothetical protein EPUL_005933, partial [Erysiphe pulchra]
MNAENQDCGFNHHEKILSLADRWILTKFNQTVKIFRESLDQYRFDLAVERLGKIAELRGTRYTLVSVLEALLRLAHPIIPFITEIIWQRVKVITGRHGDTIMLQPFPICDTDLIDTNALIDLEWIQQVIIAIRTIRSEINIAPNKPLTLFLRNTSTEAQRLVNDHFIIIRTLAQLDTISLLPVGEIGPVSITKFVPGAELLIPLVGLINKIHELDRLEKEIFRIESEIYRLESKLMNKAFLDHAPDSVVANEYEKLKTYQNSKIKFMEQKLIIAKL